MDISDEMIRHARRASVTSTSDVVAGEVTKSLQPNFFTHAISVNLRLLARSRRRTQIFFACSKMGGSAWTPDQLLRDNPHCHQWGKPPRGATASFLRRGMGRLFRDAGFANITHGAHVSRSPSPEGLPRASGPRRGTTAAFKKEGALLVSGTK